MAEQTPIDEKKEIENSIVAVEDDVLTEKEQKRVWSKIDRRIIPPLTLIYLLQYIDKSNIGNAKVAGLESQLNISSDQYTWVLSIFYFSYGLFEIPSQMILRKMRPSIFLCGMCVLFGLCLSLLGLANNYSGLLAGRFFLGVLTAPVYPGCTYYFTLWYPPEKLAFRFSLFFVAATLSGSFSGLLSAAIINLAGVDGRLGWSWIFIIFGCIAIAGGIVLFPLMHDYPETAKFLSQREKDYVLDTLTKAHGHRPEEGSKHTLTMKDVKSALTDWQVWAFCVQYFTTCTPLFSIAIFVPSIVQGLGYSGIKVQLMSVPPFACSVPAVILMAYFSDKFKRRAPFITCSFIVGLVGWILLRVSTSDRVRYAAIILAGIGHWSASPPANVAHASCLAPTSKRAVGLGILMGLGNLCGIITSNVFRSDDAPHYHKGLHAMIFFAGLGVVQTITLWIVYDRINSKRAKIWAETSQDWSEEDLRQLGDRAPNFKYMYP